jgi:predicted nucleic acid-binding protein
MNTVFLDTVGLVALWDEADQWHAAAEQSFGEIMSKRRRLGITEAFTNDRHFQAAGFTTLF